MGKKTILVVDDTLEMREVLAFVLEEEGYLVHLAANGLEGLGILEKHSVDLVISDIFMPDMDGFELSMEIRTLYPELKLVLISGGGSHSAKTASSYDPIQAGQDLVKPDRVLKKPFEPEDVIEMTQTLLQ